MPPLAEKISRPTCQEKYKKPFLDMIAPRVFDPLQILSVAERPLKAAPKTEKVLSKLTHKDGRDEQTGPRYDPDFCQQKCSANCFSYAINDRTRFSPPNTYEIMKKYRATRKTKGDEEEFGQNMIEATKQAGLT